MRNKVAFVLMVLLVVAVAGCVPATSVSNPATPTVDPDIYNQVPTTTVFEPGECTAVLEAPAPAYTSNTLGSQASGEIPAGEYEVGVLADYGSSQWYMLNNVGTANFVNASSVSSLKGACAAGDNPLASTNWQVTDYADPRNTTGMTNVLKDTTLTANFSADNVVSGSAGCNTYRGAYELEGTSLTIPGPLATTAMACAEEVMAQETVFLDNLQAVAGFKLDDAAPQLHLLNDKGQAIILLRPQ